jgi:hypothetical protein
MALQSIGNPKFVIILAAARVSWQICQLHQPRFHLIEMIDPSNLGHCPGVQRSQRIEDNSAHNIDITSFWHKLKFIPVVLLVCHIEMGTLLLSAYLCFSRKKRKWDRNGEYFGVIFVT